MKSNILLFVGVILIAVGIVVYFTIGMESTTIKVNNMPNNSIEVKNMLQYSIGGFLAGLGLLFVIIGLRGRAIVKKKQEEYMHIMQTGMSTEGTVTYVDKNYSLLVNKVPVYSIVEYTYQDKSGRQYTNRFDTLNSEQVIRKGIQIGGKIPVKYAAENPERSIIVF